MHHKPSGHTSRPPRKEGKASQQVLLESHSSPYVDGTLQSQVWSPSSIAKICRKLYKPNYLQTHECIAYRSERKLRKAI